MGRLISLTLAIALALTGTQGYADDQDRALQLREAGEILSLEKILSINEKQIEGHILEVELERENGTLIYELEILDSKGRVWELKIDATNGQIIKRELE